MSNSSILASLAVGFGTLFWLFWLSMEHKKYSLKFSKREKADLVGMVIITVGLIIMLVIAWSGIF